MLPPALIWAPTWWPTTTVTVTNLTGTPSDLLQPDEGTYLSATAAGNLVMVINLGSARTHDSVALDGEMLAGKTITVDRSPDGTTWTAVTLAVTTLANNITNMIWFTAPQTYQYFRVTIVSVPITARLYHVTLGEPRVWPWLVDGTDLFGIVPDVTVLESPQGHPLGLQRNAMKRTIKIDFGEVTISEFPPIQALIDECIRVPQCFFFCPDTSSSVAWFGYTSGNVNAPMKLGLYKTPVFNFISRMP